MTNEDVEKVHNALAAGGRKCDRFDICVYLAAREVQAKEPTNPHAKVVVDNFTDFLNGAPLKPSFARFFFDDCTDEEKECNTTSKI